MSKVTVPFTAEYLRSRVSYDPATGVFVWLAHPGKANGHRAWDRQWAGKQIAVREVQSPSGGGVYLIFRFLGRWYGAHRIAWLYMTGVWPEAEIDHRDCDSLNLKWDNLRAATRGQNQANKRPMRNNWLGIKGVYKRRSKYAAQINDGGTRHIGSFNCPTAASIAFAREHRRIHGEFSRI